MALQLTLAGAHVIGITRHDQLVGAAQWAADTVRQAFLGRPPIKWYALDFSHPRSVDQLWAEDSFLAENGYTVDYLVLIPSINECSFIGEDSRDVYEQLAELQKLCGILSSLGAPVAKSGGQVVFLFPDIFHLGGRGAATATYSFLHRAAQEVHLELGSRTAVLTVSVRAPEVPAEELSVRLASERIIRAMADRETALTIRMWTQML